MEDRLGALARRWLEGRVARGEICEESGRAAAAALAGLLRLYGDRSPDGITKRDLLVWQETIAHYAQGTRRAYTGTVVRFFGWLVDEEVLERSPARTLGKIREPRRVPRALPQGDVARVLISAWNCRWRAVLRLMVGVGLRCVDVCNLDLDDWDRDNDTILVRGKGGHERVLPVPVEVHQDLEAFCDDERGWGPGPLIPSTTTGQRLSPKALSQATANLMLGAGVHREPHDGRTAHSLRHTCLSDVYDRTKDLPLVQAIAGHQSLATTQVYLRVAGLDRMRDALTGRSYRRMAFTGTDGRSPTVSAVGSLRGAGSPGVASPEAPDPTEEGA